jgi:hypothetical protein
VQKKDLPKINSYATFKDLEQLSKDDTSEEIIKSIGLAMNGCIPFSFFLLEIEP